MRNKAILYCCTHQAVRPPTICGIMDTIKEDRGITCEFIWNDALISRSRNIAVHNFLTRKDKYQILIFVDDDILFYPSQIHILINACLNGYDIIGGFYPTKPKNVLASRLAHNTKVIVPSKEKPVPAEYVSTGFMAIHRTVLETMTKDMVMAYADRERFKNISPYWALFESMEHNGEWLSEDWAFSLKCRQKGFKCWLSPEIFLGHIGFYCYTLRDSFRQKIDENMKIEFLSPDLENKGGGGENK